MDFIGSKLKETFLPHLPVSPKLEQGIVFSPV